MTTANSYEESVANSRKPIHCDDQDIDYRELVRHASLAASSHNTQPWTFTVSDAAIRISPDFSRRCPVVDPDDAHLFKSLGCAAENIVHAAAAQRLRAEVEFDTNGHTILVHLTPDPNLTETELGRAILSRQCTKAPYDSRPLDRSVLAALEAAGTSDEVRILLLTKPDEIAAITQLVSQGNQAQLSDPRFRNELIAWVRSNDRQSLDAGDGLSGRTSGHPSVPTWLARFVVPMSIRPKSQIKTDTANIASSAGIAVFATNGDDEAAWVEVGRCYERFALTATTFNVRNAFINQPIEVTALRPELEQWLGLDDEHAQLMVRFGTGPQMPFSVRRPVDEVLTNT